jgi:hypothetical protein
VDQPPKDPTTSDGRLLPEKGRPVPAGGVGSELLVPGADPRAVAVGTGGGLVVPATLGATTVGATTGGTTDVGATTGGATTDVGATTGDITVVGAATGVGELAAAVGTATGDGLTTPPDDESSGHALGNQGVW